MEPSSEDEPLANVKRKKIKITIHTKSPSAIVESSSDDEPLANVVKRKKIKVTPPSAVKSSSSSSTKKRKREPETVTSSSTTAKKPKVPEKTLKKLDRSERLQYAMQAFLWWNAKEPPEGCQWSTMEHAGVSFPEDYPPHGVKMLYDGKSVELTPVQEEA
jgi:DNA topoisomerase-1